MHPLRLHRFLAPAVIVLTLLAAAWLQGAGALAGPAAAASHAPAAGAVRSFNLDAVHSAVVFSVVWQDMTPFYGQFRQISGSVAYDGSDASTFSCEIVIPVESIDSRNDGRDRHLKSPDFFNAREFPNITFRSTELIENGDEWTLKGELTMRGQTRPIEAKVTNLAVRDGQRGARCGFAAEFTVKRTDWGVSHGAGAGLSDEVTLMVAIQSAAQ